jgi:hypothetical protein
MTVSEEMKSSVFSDGYRNGQGFRAHGKKPLNLSTKQSYIAK